jgi:hypothetical protein
MRLAHLFETIPLNQLNNPAETRFHVGGEGFQFTLNPAVEQLNDPRHTPHCIAFLQYGASRHTCTPPDPEVGRLENGSVMPAGIPEEGFECRS